METTTKTNLTSAQRAAFDADADLVPLEQAISLVYVIAEAMEFGHADVLNYVDAVRSAHGALYNSYQTLFKNIAKSLDGRGHL